MPWNGYAEQMMQYMTGCAPCSRGGGARAGAQMRAANGPDRRSGAGAKGPPGANLFYFRKMNKGEHDDFTDADLVAEFSKFGRLERRPDASSRQQVVMKRSRKMESPRKRSVPRRPKSVAFNRLATGSQSRCAAVLLE